METDKILFVINAFGPASGAEHVLIDYLKSEKRIEPFFLIIGDHKEVLNVFLPVARIENIFYLEISSKLQTRMSRLLVYRMYRCILCQRIKRTLLYKKLNNRKDIQMVYYNNSFEASAFFPLFPHKPKIIHIHDMIDMLDLLRGNA